VGLFDFLRPKRRRRRRAVQTSAQRPRYRPGERAKRYLERVAELEDLEQRRRAQKRTTRPAGPRATRDDDPTVEIPKSVQREAERRFQARQRAEREAAEKRRRQEIRERERAARGEARMMARAEKARARAIDAYMANGATRAEAEQLYDREPDWSTYDFNPRRRGVRHRSWPRRRTNPLPPVVGEIAKDVLKGGLIAAAQEEAKARWRAARRRRNPARLEPNHPDEKLRDMSRRFHGRPDQILHLDADQRRPPPQHVVLIGHERATVYRTPRSSERSGADWEHEAGDRGMLRRNASGRRILVADERGRVYLLQGSSSMRFDPDQGLVG
jgi:hypothetical protein